MDIGAGFISTVYSDYVVGCTGCLDGTIDDQHFAKENYSPQRDDDVDDDDNDDDDYSHVDDYIHPRVFTWKQDNATSENRLCRPYYYRSI